MKRAATMATTLESKTTATSGVAVYPSLAIRPVPPFVIGVPDGWVIDEAPDSLAILRSAEQVDDFWINAIITHDRVAKAVDYAATAKATWIRLLRTNPEATVEMERMSSFGGRPTYIRAANLKAPRTGRSLAQVHAIFFGPTSDTDKTLDLFQIVCTCPAEQAASYGKQFIEIISSLRFT
jgi:hypothetical protein